MNIKIETVKEYIENFPIETQDKLYQIRQIIYQLAPSVLESISYGMPAYKTNGKPLVYFAGYAKHIGFYATPTGHQKFEQALSNYKQGKGSVQFPLNKPLPLDLITEIVKFRITENNAK